MPVAESHRLIMETITTITLEKGRHILVKNHDGSIIQDAEGNWLLMDITENSIQHVPPTQELLAFFEIDVVTEDQASFGSPCEIEKQTESPQYQSWGRQQIQLLITLYKEHIKFFNNTSLKKEKVWGMISAKLEAEGFRYTKVQCENKFKYLKGRYTKKKDNMGDKGTGQSPYSFEFYEEFDEIFGDKPNIKPVAVASSIKGCSSTFNSEKENTSESDIEPQTKKTRMEKQISKLWDGLKEQSNEREEARNKRHTERLDVMERAITAYETVMNKLIEKI